MNKKRNPVPVLLAVCLGAGLVFARASLTSPLLELLGIAPSAQSIDYLSNKREFQLHTLLTEQRHPLTMEMSREIKVDTRAGLEMLLKVDRDISVKMRDLARDPSLLEQAAQACVEAIRGGRRIYIYGCGATGRLAKQMESTFWRPFWKKLRRHDLWSKLESQIGTDPGERLIGEMTGGDRALISSLEGFEDLQLIGEWQLRDRGISRGDVIFAITEGGETSSVIGTILAARRWYRAGDAAEAAEARRHLYFICNNPEPLLLPFARSRAVLLDSGISRINLSTGPQAISGSTRMQATSSETWVMGLILEEAIRRLLQPLLAPEEMAALGFDREQSLSRRLLDFIPIQETVGRLDVQLAKLVDLEAGTYGRGNLATYFADQAIITVFIDSTERSPTFRLFPLDTVKEPSRRCWIQVWTPASDGRQAWENILGRPFRGLAAAFYEKPFQASIDDPFLRQAAQRSLFNAGDEQQSLYDFSFAQFNQTNRAPSPGDLGMLVLLEDEVDGLNDPQSPFQICRRYFLEKKASLAVIAVTDIRREGAAQILGTLGGPLTVVVPLARKADPLGLGPQIALKMLLNAHSTAVMAKLGRLVGNTMAFVSPSNLKLIGRATYLIQGHVNERLSRTEWGKRWGPRPLISYAEANAVLLAAVDFLRDSSHKGQTAEVALAIIRILEALRLGRNVSWEEALVVLQEHGLENFLISLS